MNKKIRMRRFCLVLAVICLMATSVPVFAAVPIISAEGTQSQTATVEKKAAALVNKQVKSSDSKKQKLQKLFKYAEKTYGYQRAVGFKNTDGWEAMYALSMYSEKKGSCYHFAAAYAFLAKKATNYPVRICLGTTNGFNSKVWQAHAWTEVKIGSKWYICDPNMDKFAAKSSGKYYLKDRTKLANTYKTSSRITVAF